MRPLDVRGRMAGLGRLLATQLRVVRPRLAARAALEYATHVPVLVGLGRLLRVRDVLELGAGRYSTLAFLDRVAFPVLRTLRSVEDDPAWAAAVAELAAGRPELDLTTVPPPVSAWVARRMLGDFDLILIDDSRSAAERCGTIREVMARADRRSVVVIHDFEVEAYRAAAGGARHRYRVRALNPNVGVCWWRAPISRRALVRLDELIRAHSDRIATDDVSGWAALFAREGLGGHAR